MNTEITFQSDVRIPLSIYGKDWKLEIYSRPEKKILFQGRVPSREEILDILVTTSGPAYLIDIIDVIIEEQASKGHKLQLQNTIRAYLQANPRSESTKINAIRQLLNSALLLLE